MVRVLTTTTPPLHPSGWPWFFLFFLVGHFFFLFLPSFFFSRRLTSGRESDGVCISATGGHNSSSRTGGPGKSNADGRGGGGEKASVLSMAALRNNPIGESLCSREAA